MAKSYINVWHTLNGIIVAIGRKISKHEITPVAHDGHFVIEEEIDEKLISNLHQTHIVDLKTKKLVKHTGQKLKS